MIQDNPFRVHSSAFTSDEIFGEEERRVFERCWLFVAHDSELPQPGDYRRRNLARRPMFLIRGQDGQARAFLNACTHRGSMICKEDRGSAEHFQCFFHGWTFNNQGELVATPQHSADVEGLDMAELGLRPLPRLASANGFHFASFQPDIDDLDVQLPALSLGAAVKTMVRANWKLLLSSGRLIFPNLMVDGGRLRQLTPLAPDLTEVLTFEPVDGFGIFESRQEALAAGEPEWLDLRANEPFWSHWQQLVAGEAAVAGVVESP